MCYLQYYTLYQHTIIFNHKTDCTVNGLNQRVKYIVLSSSSYLFNIPS